LKRALGFLLSICGRMRSWRFE